MMQKYLIFGKEKRFITIKSEEGQKLCGFLCPDGSFEQEIFLCLIVSSTNYKCL